jgi:hypothetical protein
MFLINNELEDKSITTVFIGCSSSKNFKGHRMTRQSFLRIMDKQLCDSIMNIYVFQDTLYVDMLFASVGMLECLTA